MLTAPSGRGERSRLKERWTALAARSDRGAGGESLELVMIAVGLVVVILIGIAAGRASLSSGRVDQSAAAGARAASLTRTATAAQVAASAAVNLSLNDAGLTCQNLQVRVDTSGFAAPPGQPASVIVGVSCSVEWGDLGIPGWPGSKVYNASAASPLDVHRERT